VSAFFSSITTAQVHVNAGKLRPIAVTTTKRSPQVPETPTFAEAGYPDVVVNAWYGMLTTGGTPKARVERLGAALQQVLADPQVRDQIQKQGLNAEPSSPEEFAKLIRTEMVKWAKVVNAAGIQPNRQAEARKSNACNGQLKFAPKFAILHIELNRRHFWARRLRGNLRKSFNPGGEP
jgi:tripartite-type tricarboxylate transporter receptor subunit TctC